MFQKRLSPVKTKRVVLGEFDETQITESVEEGADYSRALVEAVLSADYRKTIVRLHSGIHYECTPTKLYIKSHPNDFMGIFKGVLIEYKIAYVTEETFALYLKDIANPNFVIGLKP